MVRRGGQDRSIEELRQKTQHIESMSRRSDSFADFIEKRGSIEWLAPLGEALGPPLLVQLGDVANCLEVFQKYVIHHDMSTQPLKGLNLLSIAFVNGAPQPIA